MAKCELEVRLSLSCTIRLQIIIIGGSNYFDA